MGGGAIGRGKPSDWKSGGGEQVRIILGSPKPQHENSVKKVYYLSALSLVRPQRLLRTVSGALVMVGCNVAY